MRRNYLFTSESVSEGHPDKIADQISDLVVDMGLKAGDETTRVACETLVTTNYVLLAGEVKNFNVSNWDLQVAIGNLIEQIGYDQKGFSYKNFRFDTRLHSQSVDIGLGTDSFGAGDQGLMFGYACDEAPHYMPMAIYFAHQILKDLKKEKQTNLDLGPDAKSQVTLKYSSEHDPEYATKVVVSTQHSSPEVLPRVRDRVIEIARNTLGNFVTKDTEFLINPTGNFVIGGPDGDAGITGRKIIVDTYGGYAPHGGGAFSGKDPSKVDRSAAYMARWLAKNIVYNGWASWATVQLAYAIGVKEPMSVYVDSDGDSDAITEWLVDNIDLTPKGIIDRFDLFNFHNYHKTCTYGHFGRMDVPWEQVEDW